MLGILKERRGGSSVLKSVSAEDVCVTYYRETVRFTGSVQPFYAEGLTYSSVWLKGYVQCLTYSISTEL